MTSKKLAAVRGMNDLLPADAPLWEWFGVTFAFRWTGAALAAAVMAFPLLVRAIRLAIEDGDHQRGVQLIGQVQGLLDDIPTVNELFQRLLSEARATRDTLPT